MDLRRALAIWFPVALLGCARGTEPASADAASEVVAADTGEELSLVDVPGLGADGPREAPDGATDGAAEGALDVAICATGQALCDGVCTAIQVDARHCGACDRRCAGGERCEAGTCRLTCPAGQAVCMGVDGASSCVTLATDRAHCGACGNACPADRVCSMGRCAAACAAGSVLCTPMTGAMPGCADLRTDPRHCGMCNSACLPSESCVMGMCRLVCPPGETACAGRCVSLATDGMNCGACGNACGAGRSCEAGSCRLVCAAPARECAGACRDLSSDALHCGACGRGCAPGEACVEGRCALVCAPGLRECAGACRDLRSDRSHCGSCGAACAVGQVCQAGRCAVACTAPQVACAGACVTPATDASHCGRCGNACPTGANATAQCSAGTCGLACRAGYGDCDRMAGNGCETSLSSTMHCGACGVACGPFTGATAFCLAGRCRMFCASNRGDCNASMTDGCETDLATSAAHCGACGRSCALGTRCAAGACTSAGRLIDDWEVATWPRAPWVAVGAGGGATATSCAHAGLRGIQDPGWHYRTDVSVGAVGERLSVWVRFTGSGRFYLGFGASSAGAWSAVAAPNTREIEVQRNAGYAFTTVASVAFTWTTGSWYRVEVAFASGGSVTVRVYGADGTSVLGTLTTTLMGFVPGGVAVRGFGGACADTLERR